MTEGGNGRKRLLALLVVHLHEREMMRNMVFLTFPALPVRMCLPVTGESARI